MQKLLSKRTTLSYRRLMFLVSALTSTQYGKHRMSESALCK